MRNQEDITQILCQWQVGHENALENLIPLVYDELGVIARAKLKDRPNHSLYSPTALVNEACVKLLKLQPNPERVWSSRAEFYALISTMMRHILVDHAKSRQAFKHGGDRMKVTLEPDQASHQGIDILHLDLVLSRLERMNPRQAQVWQSRYLCGLSISEIADLFKLAQSSIQRDLKAAKAWIRLNLAKRAV